MSVFRKRTNTPNQLETLRKIEAEVEVGKVLYTGKGLAIIEGMNNDAPVGTKVNFVSGARGDNICFVLLLGGQPGKGEGVVCQIKAILQIIDESKGPSTKRDYDIAKVPVGKGLSGQCTDFLGRPPGGTEQLGTEAELPLFNQQVSVDDREQIAEALLTGVKAVDILTPIGRGQAQLITGPQGSGKTSLVLDAIIGQKRTGVQCIYAAVGQSPEQEAAHVSLLRSRGALGHTSVVSAPVGSNLGARFAALCAACSRGECVRDAGGHSLVVLDDISCMVEMWEHITQMLVGLGSAAVDLDDEQLRGQLGDPEKLVEHEGMLVSVAAAQRRRFFSMLVQRAAKMHRRKGGGSMTVLLVLPGRPATGTLQRQPDAAAYRHLSPQLRAKLEAVLARGSERAGSEQQASTSGARTEIVEEFMSMADGQTVVVRETAVRETSSKTAGVAASAAAAIQDPERMVDADAVAGGFGSAGRTEPTALDAEAQVVRVDVAASVSRIGGRAHPAALRELAQAARLELMQALDAARFSSRPGEPPTARSLQRAQRLTSALAQLPGYPVPLEEQVAILFALQSGLLKDVAPRHIPLWLSIYVQFLWKTRPQAMRSVAVTRELQDGDTDLLQAALEEALAQFGTL